MLVTVNSPENKTYYTSSVTVNFSASKQTAKATYSLDGNEGITLLKDCTLTGLSIGTHQVMVYAEDAFGNLGTSETVTFEVALPITSPSPTPTETPSVVPSSSYFPTNRPISTQTPTPTSKHTITYIAPVAITAIIATAIGIIFYLKRVRRSK